MEQTQKPKIKKNKTKKEPKKPKQEDKKEFKIIVDRCPSPISIG